MSADQFCVVLNLLVSPAILLSQPLPHLALSPWLFLSAPHPRLFFLCELSLCSGPSINVEVVSPLRGFRTPDFWCLQRCWVSFSATASVSAVEPGLFCSSLLPNDQDFKIFFSATLPPLADEDPPDAA